MRRCLGVVKSIQIEASLYGALLFVLKPACRGGRFRPVPRSNPDSGSRSAGFALLAASASLAFLNARARVTAKVAKLFALLTPVPCRKYSALVASQLANIPGQSQLRPFAKCGVSLCDALEYALKLACGEFPQMSGLPLNPASCGASSAGFTPAHRRLGRASLASLRRQRLSSCREPSVWHSFCVTFQSRGDRGSGSALMCGRAPLCSPAPSRAHPAINIGRCASRVNAIH
jgi:hypothetical protein